MTSTFPRLTPSSLVPRIAGLAGVVVLVASLLTSPPTAGQWIGAIVTTVVTVIVRLRPISLTKYASLTGTSFVALAGALSFGIPAAATGLAGGILLGDILHHRKQWWWAGVNAGREVLALIASYGWFAWLVRFASGEPGLLLTTDRIPALSVFFALHFVVSRGLQYFSLLERGKLAAEDRALILRYEVIAFGASVLGVVVVVMTLQEVGALGWAAVAAALGFGTLLFRRILQEAIEVEELNIVHEIERAVTSDASMLDALDHVASVANRLIDWRDLRVWRQTNDSLTLLYSSDTSYAATTGATIPNTLQRLVIDLADVILVSDTSRDPRARALHDAGFRSAIVAPLRFGERTLGTIELLHGKRNLYGTKDVALVRRLSSHVATAMQIQDLRRPLTESVARLERQVDTLNQTARDLRQQGESVARLAGAMNRSIAEESEQLNASQSAVEGVHDGVTSIARDASDAATASERAAGIASEHRETIGVALGHLDQAKGFAADSTTVLQDLGEQAQRASGFIAVIRDLAEQTNLLALNAAIEAARAGEQGRGFAVVSEEIRRLAEQSQRASEDATQLVGQLSQQMERAGRQMARGRELVGDVESLSGSAQVALAAIREAVESAGGGIRQIALVSQSQESDVARVRERVHRIVMISKGNASSANEVVAASEAQARALVELEGATRDLRELATSLAGLTRQLTRIG